MVKEHPHKELIERVWWGIYIQWYYQTTEMWSHEWTEWYERRSPITSRKTSCDDTIEVLAHEDGWLLIFMNARVLSPLYCAIFKWGPILWWPQVRTDPSTLSISFFMIQSNFLYCRTLGWISILTLEVKSKNKNNSTISNKLNLWLTALKGAISVN